MTEQNIKKVLDRFKEMFEETLYEKYWAQRASACHGAGEFRCIMMKLFQRVNVKL